MGEQDANYRFAAEATIEPDHIARARAHALELGAAPISPGVGAQCAVISAVSQALNIVEIGTGAGVSGLWLLHGSPRATLTTIDNEPSTPPGGVPPLPERKAPPPNRQRAEHLAAARHAFADAKVPPARARFITGRAAEVLPRMNEASYDI